MLSDFRYPGGTSASIAEEIDAQHAAGLSTVLVHVPADHLRSVAAFHSRVAATIRSGRARLALPGDEVSAKLLVIRQPRVLDTEPNPVPSVHADRVVMVMNQPPRDRGQPNAYYDLSALRERVERLFGRPEWAPIGPLVRQALVEEDPTLELTTADWVNVIDVDAWRVDRGSSPRHPIVVGRFSRPDPRKWPTTNENVLLAYPQADDIRVRVLGGGEIACERLGYRPPNWEVFPFGSMDPRAFVQSIDLFVYFHDPALVEAFGRTTLEAMASGAPAILPHTFEPLFRDSAIYASPAEVAAIVRRLRDDPDEYRQWSVRASSFVEREFSHQVHVERVRVRLGDAGRQTDGAVAVRSKTAPGRQAQALDRVLMLSSNGGGLGHVTRLMAIGRRLPRSLRPVVATQSQAAPLVHGEGFPVEYVPSRGYLDVPEGKWNDLLRQRLLHLIDWYAPRLVLVDGTVPYSGLLSAMTEHHEIPWVWLRRGMWKPNLGREWIRRGRAFDAVIEPGDYSEDDDGGLTVAERKHVHLVGPITYLDEDELSDRALARETLGLPSDVPIALLQLGAGNINDIQSPVGRIASRLVGKGVKVVVAQSPISTQRLVVPSGVEVVSQYPLSRHIRAFDFVISAGGYNTFHECIGFATPAVFVPNLATALDDQATRVAGAQRRGLALSMPSLDDHDAVIDEILRPEVRAALAERCALVRRDNGAAGAAAVIADLAGVREGASA